MTRTHDLADPTGRLLSVIIPTHGRPRELERCLRALGAQETAVPFEVVVVDDGSPLPVTIGPGAPAETRVIRRDRARGPAAARNLGVANARADVLVFTDDDTMPAVGWLAAVAAHLSQHPDHVGVEGPTESPPYDPLTEHTIEHLRGGYVTANIAYRRSAFERVDGFHEGFPHPHCEDLDLAFRIVRLGRIGFAPGMRVVHPPKSMSVRQQLRRGRMTSSEVVLRARHPELFRDYLWLPIRLRPPINLIRDRVRLLRHRRRARDLSLRRVTLWGVVTGGQAAIAVVGCLRQAPTSGD